MNKLFVILLSLLIVLYIRFNFKYNKEYEIIQTSPSKITVDILNERNPIVVENLQDGLAVFVHSAFRYLYIHKKITSSVTHPKPVEVTSRFCVITPASDDTILIDIINPKYNADDYRAVSIKLKTGNALILPIYWRFTCASDVNCVYLYDVFATVYSAIKR